MSQPTQFTFLQKARSRSKARPDPNCPPGVRAIAVPEGPSFLRVHCGRVRAVRKQPKTTRRYVLEPLDSPHHPGLLMVSPPEHRPGINGIAAPCVAVLHEKDQLLLAGASEVLHVTCYRAGTITAVPADLVGKKCPVCRVPLDEGARVHLCPSCHTALHAEDPAAGEDALECARLVSECPGCSATVHVSEAGGYSYIPPDLAELEVAGAL